MKLHLEATGRRKWAITSDTGQWRGMVWRDSRRHKPYLVRGKNLHTLFEGGTPELRFQTLAEVRRFINDNPKQYWRHDKSNDELVAEIIERLNQ